MGIGMAKKDFKKLVRKWCEEEGLFDEEVEDKNSEFNYVINYPLELEHKINILQPGDSQDKIIVLSGTRFEPETVERMRNLPQKELEDLLWDIRLTLCARPTEFELRRPEDQGAPEVLVITALIYSDGLSKDRLMTAIRDVYKSKLLAVWKIQQRTEV